MVRKAMLIVATICLLLALAPLATAQSQTEVFNVDGIERRALVYPNSKSGSGAGVPVVLVYHGHGGNAQNVARRLGIHGLWPEAVVVYLQGMPGVPGITDPEGRLNGWQKAPGEVGDRDIKFFDAVLDRIQKKYKIDPNRVYLFGHSNGGRFVNVLWNMRGDKLAAICSAAGPGGRLIEGAMPKPVFIIAGEKDAVVPFETQKASIELARKLLRTDQSKAKTAGFERIEPGVNGTELVTYIHPAGHDVPIEALPGVIKFFQRHTMRVN